MHARGLCARCYMRVIRESTGLRDPDAGLPIIQPFLPPRLLGIVHHCFTTTVEARCGKCGRATTLELRGRELHCGPGGCGWTAWRVSTGTLPIDEALVTGARGTYAPRSHVANGSAP